MKKIISYIKESKSQILVLSEYRNNKKGTEIRKYLLDLGYCFQAVSLNNSAVNSVLIASKIAFNSTIYSDIDPEYSANLILAEFSFFRLFGCYLPHKKKHVLFDFLLSETASGIPSIITGDLNSGINGIDQKGKSFWYEDEMIDLHKQGLKDSFRLIQKDVKEYSWYSHQGNGYRYDHYLVDEKLEAIVKDCYYDHESRESGLSDHSAMYLQLGV